MNFFAVLLCVFLAGIQSSQGRTFPAPLPTSYTHNDVMLPGRRDGNECTKTDGNTLPVKPRIVGGTEAEKHEFPWVVALRFYKPHLKEYRQVCGASVIDEWWIMTAAHCVPFNSWGIELDKDLEVWILAGEHQLSVLEDEQYRKVENIVIHPEWNNVTSENDIALLKLSEKLELNGKSVAPISLPTPLTKSTGECVVAGWGGTTRDFINIEDSDVLKKVTVPIVSDKKCKEIYDSTDTKIFDSMICAGYEEDGRGFFKGDSGGALVCQGENNDNYVAGVVSFSEAFLDDLFPDVYTEVSYFVDWINEVRNQESLQH